MFFHKMTLPGGVNLNKINSFLIIGGDSRQIYMADYLESLGFEVSVYGLPENNKNKISNIKNEIKNFDAVVLPLPVSKDGKYIYSVASLNIATDDIVNSIKPEQAVFAGMISKGTETKIRNKNAYVYDYFKREDVTVMNTVPTVQGIIKSVIDNIDYTVFSSRCAVFGYGRVARITADTLSSLGADVTVCARKNGDLAIAETKKMKGCRINRFHKIANEYDIVINTVPSLVIDKEILKNLKKDCLVIDVSSSPFGVDFTAAYELEIKAIQCPSLPGKVAPKSAGKIIADGILNIIREEFDE